MSETFSINSTIFNIQLVSSVISVVDISRFSSLQVQIKDEADDDSAYNTNDLTTDTTEIGVIAEDNITFLQIL